MENNTDKRESERERYHGDRWRQELQEEKWRRHKGERSSEMMTRM